MLAALTSVGNPEGGADCGTVMVKVKLPCESVVTLPAGITAIQTLMRSAGQKPVPVTVTGKPLGTLLCESVMIAFVLNTVQLCEAAGAVATGGGCGVPCTVGGACVTTVC